jgi:hypothetical protein
MFFVPNKYLNIVSSPLAVSLYLQQLTEILAPLMPDVDIFYDIVQFNGSLFKQNIFRQNAGPEVDAAWESLGVDCWFFSLQSQFLLKSPRQGCNSSFEHSSEIWIEARSSPSIRKIRRRLSSER